MIYDLGGRRLRLQEGDRLECAQAIERAEQSRLWAFAPPLGQNFGSDGGMVEDRAGELGQQIGKLALLDLEACDFLGKMIEQPGVVSERQNDGDGEAMRGRKRPGAGPAGR